MNGKCHLAFGISSSLATMAVAKTMGIEPDTTNMAIIVASAACGSLLPDIDTSESLFGRLVPFFSNFINKVFGHRTITHDLMIWFPMFIISIFVKNPIFFGIMFGYIIGHLFLDAMTKEGICFNYFGHRKALMSRWRELGVGTFYILPEKLRFRSNSFFAKVLTYVMCVGCLYVSYNVFIA